MVVHPATSRAIDTVLASMRTLVTSTPPKSADDASHAPAHFTVQSTDTLVTKPPVGVRNAIFMRSIDDDYQRGVWQTASKQESSIVETASESVDDDRGTRSSGPLTYVRTYNPSLPMLAI